VTDLITRLERAEGPDRELDCRIWCVMRGADFDLYSQVVPNFNEWQALRYTASIDAALTLVPDEYLLGILAELENGRWTTKLLNRREIAGLPPESGPTPALALCIAALRAQQKDTNA